MELNEKNIVRDLSILNFIYTNEGIFRDSSLWTPWKIGERLQRNKFISRREFYRSDIWRQMVVEGVFISQSNTYKYDRERMIDVIKDTLKNDAKIRKIVNLHDVYLSILRKKVAGMPLVIPSDE